MNDNDKREFSNAISQVFKIYGKPPPEPALQAMYFTALSHISIDDFKVAANLHLRDTDQGQYLPKPADILRNLQGNKATQAEQAWTKVDKAIRVRGPYYSLVFDDSIIHAVIDDMGGWISLCNSDEKEYPFKHKEFVTRYSGFINKAPTQYPKKLIGIEEANNSQEGFKSRLPELIGNPEKAIAVLNGGDDSSRVQIRNIDNINFALSKITDNKFGA